MAKIRRRSTGEHARKKPKKVRFQAGQPVHVVGGEHVGYTGTIKKVSGKFAVVQV